MDSLFVVIRDLIAQALGTLAILMVVGMIFGVVSVSPLTLIAVAGMGCISAIAEIQMFRRLSSRNRSDTL